MEANEKNLVEGKNRTEVLDVAVQKTQVTLSGSDETQPCSVTAEEKPKPMYLFVCEICQDEFTSQLKFFGHLKAHYEDLQQSQKMAEAVAKPHMPVSPEQTESCDTTTGDGGTEPQFHNYTSEESSKGVTATGNKTAEKVEEVEKAGSPKLVLSCSKCKRTFRREKTYQAHIESCQKPPEIEEETILGDLEPKGKAKVRCSSCTKQCQVYRKKLFR